MTLIADSGSTKTDWCLAQGGEVVARMATQGINPFYQSDEEITRILQDELMSQWPEAVEDAHDVFFYGAGVRPEMAARMKRLVGDTTRAAYVEAHGDLLGAARALFGKNEGIACILGTGANSGLYDGTRIVQNTPPLGFILGDEGSGAVMGKRFVADLCKGLMPEGLMQEFKDATHQDVADIINAVYRQPLPNRYLASTTRFIHQHLNVEQVNNLVVDNFRDFFRRNLVQYQRRDLPVKVIGSIAFHFREQLACAAEMEGFALNGVEQGPMLGLVAFHSGNYSEQLRNK
ncbi:MAG: ATPase [Prevotella sp.]|nr:ATPase [Prevotella sp.]